MQAEPTTKYHVTVNATCEMVVEVEASSEAEAKRRARACDYEPLTHWGPLDYGKLRAVYVEVDSALACDEER